MHCKEGDIGIRWIHHAKRLGNPCCWALSHFVIMHFQCDYSFSAPSLTRAQAQGEWLLLWVCSWCPTSAWHMACSIIYLLNKQMNNKYWLDEFVEFPSAPKSLEIFNFFHGSIHAFSHFPRDHSHRLVSKYSLLFSCQIQWVTKSYPSTSTPSAIATLSFSFHLSSPYFSPGFLTGEIQPNFTSFLLDS